MDSRTSRCTPPTLGSDHEQRARRSRGRSSRPTGRHTVRTALVFIYTVRITNEGDDNVQLLSRHWIITDATPGTREEVRGPGVVGRAAAAPAGRVVSVFVELRAQSTSTGVMQRARIRWSTEDGEHFDVEIAPFALHEPSTRPLDCLKVGTH